MRFQTAVRGWIGFVEGATIDWCANPRMSRDELRELLAAILFAIIGVVGAADPESRHSTVSRTVVIVDRFAPEAEALRATFDERFAEPRSTRADRFVWDWWHVPGQYTALRTPAWTYFPKRVYEAFHRRLVAWGRETLGCHDISPPWLSLYIDGCRQELHGDLPHGPFAFVFSLTHWRGRVFTGGETLLVRDEVLDFWHDFRIGTRRRGTGAAARDRAALRSADGVRSADPARRAPGRPGPAIRAKDGS